MTDSFVEPFVDALNRGGPVLWVIAGLSILTLALILWKLMQLSRLGAWSRRIARAALRDWENGAAEPAVQSLERHHNLRARMAAHAMHAYANPDFTDADAREEVARFAKADLAQTRTGLRALELISTIAPLLGLLGTVLGMITAFQTLQESGAQADPAALAGGIWEALLTTAAGMAVAIPAGVALSWFEGIAERIQADLEDIATRVFTRGPMLEPR